MMATKIKRESQCRRIAWKERRQTEKMIGSEKCEIGRGFLHRICNKRKNQVVLDDCYAIFYFSGKVRML